MFIYQNREYFGKRAQRALTNIILVAVINFVIGLSPGIDNWGHLGGFLGGTVFAWFGGPLLQGGLRHTQEGFALILTDERSVQEQMISALTVGTVMVGLVIWYMFLF